MPHMSHCTYVILHMCHIVHVSHCIYVTLHICPIAHMSHCTYVILRICHIAHMSHYTCHIAHSSHCRYIICHIAQSCHRESVIGDSQIRHLSRPAQTRPAFHKYFPDKTSEGLLFIHKLKSTQPTENCAIYCVNVSSHHIGSYRI